MVTAFVLVNIDGKNVTEIAEDIQKSAGVREVHLVAGEYDIVVVMRVNDNVELSRLLTDEIIHTPGVMRTKTLVSLSGYSNE